MKKNGVALGGGAVLGAAHIGILQALDERNITFDFLSGTSIGAFVASLYAFKLSVKEIKDIALKIRWMDISSIAFSGTGLLSNDKLGELLIEFIGDKNIEQSEIPLSIIATDITSGEKVVLNKGSVANAVIASTCIPGVFSPVEVDGKLLVDGGIVENVPIDTVKSMGADFIIAVDLDANKRFHKPKNLFDVMVNSFHFMLQNAVKYQTQEADLLIAPDLTEFNMIDTKQIKALIFKGYKDACNILGNNIIELS